MPDWLAIAILGIIEGVTEFLPVSSTGHLLLAEQWLPRQTDLFNVVIQSGAVLAVLAAFQARLRHLLCNWRDHTARSYMLKLATAFFITAVGGLALKKLHFKLPETVLPVALATLVGGILFLMVEWWLKGRPLEEEITWKMAILMGSAQLVAAVFPGTSRSGATILIALVLGLNRVLATEFSFFLGVPTLLAAGGLKTIEAIREPAGDPVDWAMIALGSMVAAVTAFVSVKWLLRFVQTHTFNGFGWYRIALGAAMLVFRR